LTGPVCEASVFTTLVGRRTGLILLCSWLEGGVLVSWMHSMGYISDGMRCFRCGRGTALPFVGDAYIKSMRAF